jgi:CheY-like chemotaxis protein/signal transduction histidine kinase
MRLKLPIIAKLTALVVAAVILTALAVNQVYIYGSNRILIDQAISDLENETKLFQYPLGNIIDRLKDDVSLLANVQATQDLVRARLHDGMDPQSGLSEVAIKDRLAVTFIEIMRTREHYRRVRFIGVASKGKEILRVERLGNRIIRLPDDGLKHWENEIYFQEALRLNPGEIYLSETTLDKDQDGKIITPHTLVLRAAVPLYTADKNVFGFILINMDFGMVLKGIKENLLANRSLYITNTSGDYLVHPDPSRLYAGDLGHDHRIQRDDPRLVGPMGNGKQDRATFLPEDTVRGNIFTFEKYHYDLINQKNYLGVAIEAPYRDIISKTKDVERQGFLFSGGIAFIAALAAIFLLRLLIRPLNGVADAVVRYRKGEKNIDLPTDSPDEIGILAREFQAMMKQKDEEDWVKENLVRISQSILGFKNLQDFANILMESLTLAANAQVGVLYISNSFAGRHTQHDAETLSFFGACGFRESDAVPHSFRWGEGLVGQCAKDRKARVVSDIPEDYLRVASALGESKPKEILLLPVLFENTLVGVIELASLGGFTDIQRSFLEQIGFNIGVIINSISASVRTEELLEETRMTAEELQRSEEELKVQQEELEASNEEMEEKTKALEEQNAQIRQQTRELNESKKLIEGKAKELELSSKYKSEFLANMSHELRTPLNSLLILSKSLASNEEGNLTAEQVEEASVIYNGGLDLLTLINDILDLSKVEAGKLNIVTEDAQLTEIVKRLEQQFEPVAKEAGVAFQIEMAGNLPGSIYTDGHRVEQILKNILSNAFKFTQTGSVTLNVFRPGKEANLQRSSLEHGNAVAFAVTDTGIGIETSKLNDIFEAFQQEDGSTDRHYGGTGLGLTIARKFAHMLGGEIHAVSKKGTGSTFTLMLPVTLAQANSSTKNEESAIPHHVQEQPTRMGLKTMPKTSVHEFIADDRSVISEKDKILLLIEDDKNFSQTLMKTARKRGYKCLAAGDGKAGILLAAEYPVSAIILDLRLPDIDGVNVLDQLKHDLRTRHIPVHIITGLEKINAIAPLRKGAIGCLIKPAKTEDIDGVFKKIEDVLQSEIKRILVVEDDKKSQAAIQKLLKKKDVEIVCVGTGNAALGRIENEWFDCIILDLLLPDMTGFEWLDEVEKQAGGADLPPVIVYTAKDLTEEENRKLSRHTGNIVIKGAHSSERLLDEVTLFLHSIESTLSRDQQAMIRMQHDPDKVLIERKVLLVDDDMRNTFALSKLLKKHGMNVVLADNGQMALEKLRQEQAIELIIMDIMMPVMDGYQAMRTIRADKSLQAIPIIAMTARAMPEEQQKCIEAGASDYMVKPVDIERLLTLMRVWLFKQDSAT